MKDLTWRSHPDKVVRSHSNGQRKYRIPSFSWLSVERTVSERLSPYSEDLAEIVGIDIQYVTDDTTGLVNGGSLRLRGRLRHIELQNTSDTEKIAMKLDGELISIKFLPDIEREDFWGDNRRQEVFIVPLVRTSFLGDIEGLVLERASGESSFFQRIGIFSTPSWDDKDPILQDNIEKSCIRPNRMMQ